MSVLCDLDYVEKTLEAPTGSEAVWRAVRDYQKVSADVKVGDGQFKPTLKPEHRLIAAEAARQTTLLFSPRGNLTRDELDAIDIQANTLLLDRLLPEKAVAVGDRWPHSAELAGGLARPGRGCQDHRPEHVEGSHGRRRPVRAHRPGRGDHLRRLDRHRDQGPVSLRSPNEADRLGGNVGQRSPRGEFRRRGGRRLRLAIIITPVPAPASLADEALAGLTLKPTPKLLDLMHESPGGWRCTYDRRWYLHYDRPKNSVVKLKFVDQGTPIGECFASSLPQRDPDKLVSLEEFQEDVRRALGKSFGEFVEAGQSMSAANYRVYRVVVHGTSAEIAMRWIYYLVADPQGRQVAFRFPIEQRLVERFAEADKPLVESLRFVEKRRDEGLGI